MSEPFRRPWVALLFAGAVVAAPVSAAATDVETMPDYPSDAVLAAFATACSGIENMAVARASALAAGWEDYQPADDEPVAVLAAFGRAQVEQEAAADRVTTRFIDGGIFRKTVAGRALKLVLSGIDSGNIVSQGCRIYDFEARARLDDYAMERWAVRKPVAAPAAPGGSRHVWNPGLKPGHMEMDISFVPQGIVLPPPVTGLPLRGLVFGASHMDIRSFAAPDGE